MTRNRQALIFASFLILNIISIFPIVKSPKQNVLLGKEIYFQRQLSNIDSYKTLSFQKPKSKTPYQIIIEGNETKDYYVDGWISPIIPIDLELEGRYNFLFSVWGQGYGNASFYFKFYLLRKANETFLFETLKSEFLNLTTCELLWQNRMNEALSLKKGDMIVCKLFLHVEVIGIFSFFCDGKEYPSYLKDPTETRYFRDEKFGVNGIWHRGLKTSQGIYPATHGDSITEYGLWIKLGIRVYERIWNSTKFEITNGIPQAQVLRTSEGEGYQQATWDCPEYEFYDNRSNVLVYVYHQFEGYEWTFDNWYFRWHTEQLGAEKLNASTWTVTYYWKLYWLVFPSSSGYQFFYNVASKNSKIENFVWTEYTPPIIDWALWLGIALVFSMFTFVFIVANGFSKKRR